LVETCTKAFSITISRSFFGQKKAAQQQGKNGHRYKRNGQLLPYFHIIHHPDKKHSATSRVICSAARKKPLFRLKKGLKLHPLMLFRA